MIPLLLFAKPWVVTLYFALEFARGLIQKGTP